jgi:uncharacterized protein YycO
VTPQPGDVVLVSRGNGLFDRLVRWATVSPYFHAAIMVSETDLVEARLHGVKRRPLSEYGGHATILTVSGANPGRRAKAVQFAIESANANLPYGWRDIVADALRLGLRIPVGYRWFRWNSYDCSALVAECWRVAGVSITYHPAPAPADLGWSPVLIGPRVWETAAKPQ